MRMCRRFVARTLPKEIIIPATNVRSWKGDTPAYYAENGNVGCNYWGPGYDRVYCRIDFTIPYRIKKFEGTFTFGYQQGNAVRDTYANLFLGSFPTNRAPYNAPAGYEVWFANLYGQWQGLTLPVTINQTIEKGDYCLYFWSAETSLRLHRDLFANKCIMKGYTRL